MAIRGRSLSILVHSDTKVGKSTFANTAPAPRVLFDAEAAHRFLPGNKVYWEPQRDAPPAYDGSWETCVVVVREYRDLIAGVDWLKSGQHHFESAIVDSISEVQVKAKEEIGGEAQMDQQKWGQLLAHMEQLIRVMRDLTEHPTHPLTAVVFTAMTEKRDEKWRPYVQGQFRTKLPYFLDIVGYMFIQATQSNDPTLAPTKQRYLLTHSTQPMFEAGERVQGRIPEYVIGDQISIPWMLDAVFGALPQEAGAAADVPVSQ